MSPTKTRMHLARFKAIMDLVHAPGFQFEVRKSHGGFFLRASAMAYDIAKGKELPQQSRKWLLSPYATESEVVQTAFKCVLTFHEHEVREAFKYDGENIFAPHYDVRTLANLCRLGGATQGARK